MDPKIYNKIEEGIDSIDNFILSKYEQKAKEKYSLHFKSLLKCLTPLNHTQTDAIKKLIKYIVLLEFKREIIFKNLKD
jgi:hypothetical protein